MPHRTSIRVLLVRLVLAVALPLAALEAWNLYAAAQADSQRARQQAFQLAQVTASEIARFLGQAHNTLKGLAARTAVGALDPVRCDPILKDFLDLAPRFSNVVTATIDGRAVCSAVPLAGPTRFDPDIFLNRLRGPDKLTVGQVTPGIITGRWAVPVGVPLLDAQGGIAGGVALTVSLLDLPVLPSVEGLHAGTVVGLIDADGTILAHSREAERFVGTRAGAGRAPMRERAGTAEVMGIDGVPRIQGFTPVPGTDWIVVASFPSSEVYAAANARVARSALLALAILSAALLLAVRWSRKIRAPITALAAAATEIAAGNVVARAPVAGATEIAEVATQFNRMLDAGARADAALKESEARFRGLSEASFEGLAILQEGRILVANQVLADLTGYELPELIGLDALTLAAPESRDLVRQHILSGDENPYEVIALRKDGTRLAVEAMGRSMPYQGRTVTVTAARDITGCKQAEAALRASELLAGLGQAARYPSQGT